VASLFDLVFKIVSSNRLDSFKFVEIGVFKGDNAVAVVSVLSRSMRQERIYYVGFDIFEDLSKFVAEFPEDFSLYDHPEWPYFEFRSGLHTFDHVQMKLGSILPKGNFDLVRGDSRETVARNLHLIEDANIVYIDGCHAYEVVKTDWLNVTRALDKNPNIVVVFDDSTYEGVAKIRNEITMTGKYQIFDLNDNQFFVVLKRAR
jgi:hypothetical protein